MLDSILENGLQGVPTGVEISEDKYNSPGEKWQEPGGVTAVEMERKTFARIVGIQEKALQIPG